MTTTTDNQKEMYCTCAEYPAWLFVFGFDAAGVFQLLRVKRVSEPESGEPQTGTATPPELE